MSSQTSADQELSAWLRLVLTPGVGNDAARRLLAAFGLPEAIFDAGSSALRQVVGAAQAQALKVEPAAWRHQVDVTQAWLGESGDGYGRRIVTLGDSDYPSGLLAMEDPPLMLYLLGQLPASAWPERALAMVGSRSPTPQGEQNAREFARHLVDGGWCVVSGMALGIDGAAHGGALQAAMETNLLPSSWATIAVIGTGIDRVYPRAHRALAQQIARHGVIVSEYPLGTPPLAPNFPKRNRLISGLSRGTLVVEAALKSGSLITARLAAEQGKEVFAIPGSIHSPLSRGCHSLIRQGAKLVETAQDILEELQGVVAVRRASPTPDAVDGAEPLERGGDGDTQALLNAVGGDPVGFDALQARTGLATDRLQALLLELELDGQLARLPGGLFQRLALG